MKANDVARAHYMTPQTRNIQTSNFMEIYRIIGALIEGVLFALLMWIGDEFILNNDNALYVYAIQAIIFAVAMYLFDRFFNRKNKNS